MTPAEAIEQFTRHIRRYSHIGLFDIRPGRPTTDAEIAARKAKVEGICDEIDAVLADHSPSLEEFEAFRQRLGDINAAAPLADLRAVEDAFLAAK